MCRDFLRLGYSRMVVDPGVRLAYTADVARQRYTQKVPGSASVIHKSTAPRQTKHMATCKSRPAEVLTSSLQQEAAASSLKALQAISAALVARLSGKEDTGAGPQPRTPVRRGR